MLFRSYQIDSLYQLEKLKTLYYSKITGIQATNYETLQHIYKNKVSVEETIAAEKDNEILDLKRRNRRLVITNAGLTISITAIGISALYLAFF